MPLAKAYLKFVYSLLSLPLQLAGFVYLPCTSTHIISLPFYDGKEILYILSRTYRYNASASFGVITSGSARALFLSPTTVAAPALEDIIIWDVRRGEKVRCLY